MEIKPLSDRVSVSGQLTVEDVAKVAEAGFAAIICNRPDGEADDQTPFAEIRAAAKEAGLEIDYIPVSPPQLTQEQVDAFKEALQDLPAPVLAYCRSGARSSSLWSIATQG